MIIFIDKIRLSHGRLSTMNLYTCKDGIYIEAGHWLIWLDTVLKIIIIYKLVPVGMSDWYQLLCTPKADPVCCMFRV